MGKIKRVDERARENKRENITWREDEEKGEIHIFPPTLNTTSINPDSHCGINTQNTHKKTWKMIKKK